MPLSRRVARFNRLVANHFVGPVLTRLPGFGTVHHLGRRSGRLYRTPVRLFRRGDDYVVTLPYGPRSDWVLNVLAAGGCELVTRGRRIRIVQARLFVDDGSTTVGALARRAMARMHSPQFLALAPAPPDGGRVRDGQGVGANTEPHNSQRRSP